VRRLPETLISPLRVDEQASLTSIELERAIAPYWSIKLPLSKPTRSLILGLESLPVY
jgi:hypothetical protein